MSKPANPIVIEEREPPKALASFENAETNSKLLQVSPCLSSAPEIPHRQIQTTNRLQSNPSFPKEALPISFAVMMSTRFHQDENTCLCQNEALAAMGAL